MFVPDFDKLRHALCTQGPVRVQEDGGFLPIKQFQLNAGVPGIFDILSSERMYEDVVQGYEAYLKRKMEAQLLSLKLKVVRDKKRIHYPIRTS